MLRDVYSNLHTLLVSVELIGVLRMDLVDRCPTVPLLRIQSRLPMSYLSSCNARRLPVLMYLCRSLCIWLCLHLFSVRLCLHLTHLANFWECSFGAPITV